MWPPSCFASPKPGSCGDRAAGDNSGPNPAAPISFFGGTSPTRARKAGEHDKVFTLIELHQGMEHPQLARRMDATRELVDEALNQVITIDAQGEGRLAQLLDVMYLGDWTSYYLALDNDVDPGPVDAIDQLKARVAEPSQ